MYAARLSKEGKCRLIRGDASHAIVGDLPYRVQLCAQRVIVVGDFICLEKITGGGWKGVRRNDGCS